MTAKMCFLSTLSAKTALDVTMRIILLIIPIWATSTVGVACSNTFTSFEKGNFSGWKKELCCKDSAQVVSSPVRDGNRALKVTYRKTDYITHGARRAELKHSHVPVGAERWYSVSIFTPTSFKTTKGGFIITQFHDKPDLGEANKIPALFLATDGQKLSLGNRWDTHRFTAKVRDVQGQSWDLGPLPKGRWIDFKYHVKWSYKSDGFLEVYMDGKRVVHKTGPNYYNDKVGPNIKIGMYASGIRSKPEKYDFDQQVLYFDAVRIGMDG